MHSFDIYLVHRSCWRLPIVFLLLSKFEFDFCLFLQADISTKADQLETEKQNLIQNIAKLENQLVKEQKSRENLEVSHLSLLSRIEQMESIMDCEKNEVSENTF